MTKRAFIFPGQGSQSIGMGAALFENFSSASLVLEEVSDALSQDMKDLILNGPESDLNLTENTQPALMAVSMAVVRVLEKDFGINLAEHATYAAGHSLGEYSALTAMGSFSISQCAKLLKLRGSEMQKAVPVGQGKMAAIIGMEMDQVNQIAKEAAEVSNAVCTSANDNSPGQVVISGASAAIEKAVELASAKGAKRALILPVSAPFHCPMMQPAADAMQAALEEADIKDPALPIIANVTAKPTQDADEIRNLLVEQVTGMVRWTESVTYMHEQEIEQTVELGAGKVLTGLNRRIAKEIKGVQLLEPADIEAFAQSL